MLAGPLWAAAADDTSKNWDSLAFILSQVQEDRSPKEEQGGPGIAERGLRILLQLVTGIARAASESSQADFGTSCADIGWPILEQLRRIAADMDRIVVLEPLSTTNRLSLRSSRTRNTVRSLAMARKRLREARRSVHPRTYQRRDSIAGGWGASAEGSPTSCRRIPRGFLGGYPSLADIKARFQGRVKATLAANRGLVVLVLADWRVARRAPEEEGWGGVRHSPAGG